MKAFLCVAVALFAISGCATSKETSQPAQAQPAPKEPAQAVPQAKPSAPPAPSEAGPTTAAEAADQVHQEWVRTHGARSGGGSGGDSHPAEVDDAPCSTDDQCALTRVAAGGCCETLCVPRAVTRARADAIATNQTSCTHGRACPDISCHPLGQSVDVKCQAGRCLARQSPASRNQ